MKAGDTIRIVSTTDTNYFQVDDKAILLYQDRDGDWWADFSINKEYRGDGDLCIGRGDNKEGNYCQIEVVESSN